MKGVSLTDLENFFSNKIILSAILEVIQHAKNDSIHKNKLLDIYLLMVICHKSRLYCICTEYTQLLLQNCQKTLTWINLTAVVLLFIYSQRRIQTLVKHQIWSFVGK